MSVDTVDSFKVEPGGYGLAHHAFVCRQEGFFVILDIRRNRYSAIDARRSSALPLWIPGWPLAEQPPCASDIALLGPLVASLQRQGVLVAPAEQGKPATPVTCPSPTRELMDDQTSRSTQWVAVMVACARTAMALRCLPFERVLLWVRRRRSLQAAASRDGSCDQELRELTSAFKRARASLFSSKNSCLYESLALLDFLAGHQWFPRWVFGVQTMPFASHCWLQHEDCVINDSLENVARYTPIMML